MESGRPELGQELGPGRVGSLGSAKSGVERPGLGLGLGLGLEGLFWRLVKKRLEWL